MITQTVPALSFVTMTLALLFGFAIPLTLLVVLVRKYGCKKLPFFVGCATFFLAAIVLEGAVHSVVLGGGRAQALMAKPLFYALYGGLMAGLFE
ncbi:MAG: YhfC family glutamic-type intramembrane protease, partial [Treponema sp.]|nr:YhfC family glutamic-type intramembrane protease [Treponema sp.]